jgi:hypothetical protein
MQVKRCRNRGSGDGQAMGAEREQNKNRLKEQPSPASINETEQLEPPGLPKDCRTRIAASV